MAAKEKDAYSVLAERHGFESSEPYLRVLQFLMTPEQADLVTLLPGSPEDVADKAGMGVAAARETIELLVRKGVVVPVDFRMGDRYQFCKYAERLWEVSESLMGLDIYTEDEYRELFRLWEEWKKTDYADMTAERWLNLKAMGIHGLRIIPAYRAILDMPDLLPQEDVREMVRVQPLITVVSCSCRKHKKMIGSPCRKSDADANCLQFAKSAEYSLSRGHGRRISTDEAVSILEMNEEDGLVHQWMNHSKVEAAPPYALCSCCRCCCTVWHAADIRSVPNDAVFARSRYEARVDACECIGCGLCMDRCQFDAINMVPVEGSTETRAVVDPEKCWGCGVCTLVCEPGALGMHLVRPPEHIPA